MAPAAMNTTAAAAEKEKDKALEDWLPITSSRNAKWWYSAFHNVTAMVCTSVLSLPYAMSELGCRVKDVIFSVASSQEGGIDIKAGSSTMHMQKHCSVHHPVVQMVLFAIKHVSEDTFCCPHSMVPKAMLDIIEKASFCEGAPLNSSGYTEERRDSNIHALGLPQSRAGDGDGGSSSTGTLVPPLYLDSGAAHHVVNDDTILINVRDPPAGTRVIVADGSEHLVTKVGDIQTTDIKIKDVYHVPQLQVCLVSVSQLTERKIDITFSGNRVELLLEGRRIGDAIIDDAKLYRLRSLQAP